MLPCDICGEMVTSESDMKSHLLIVHMENEVICPFCKLSGVNYDEMCFHIETAHFDQNALGKNFERVNLIQYGTSADKDRTLQSTVEACASSRPKCSAQSPPKDGALKQDSSQTKESVYETVHSPPECPFCGKVEECSQDIENHMKTKHVSLLDPPLEEGCDQPLYDCPMCGLICTNYHILQEHVDLHLEERSFQQGMERIQCSADLELAHQLQQEEAQKQSEESRQEMEEFQQLQRQYGLDGSGGYKQQQLQTMEIEVNRGRMHPAEFHRRKADLMESLAVGIDDGKTKTSGDKGWGCGYRNFQMLLSSLLQNEAYDDCLKGMSVPCIPKIQSMIEDAWKEGFDPQGASQLNNRLQGTKAWIGACEVFTLLTSLGVKCRIVDFHKATGPTGTHPRLFEWILNYYSEQEGSAKVVCTSKPPVYLQHQGHSRTIVGIEERKNRTLCLLIFDPGCPSREMQKLLKQDFEDTSLKQLRKFVGNLKHKQYQIVAVEGALSPEEKVARRQASQVFTAEKIP
ncbi:zinc finger with UFM1-specific peptidase domain protein isoform X2 [Octodon degus]|uniref:Zinc finger-containing ubiquitin peptidase 1 n=1 Tax=Octodon degus TaxID=10160 RepID=A0A6P6ECB4_OCTDE|nr:zinc finger with UFM1-specific peptidase domain protein isoform X2 [Octodon degus]